MDKFGLFNPPQFPTLSPSNLQIKNIAFNFFGPQRINLQFTTKKKNIALCHWTDEKSNGHIFVVTHAAAQCLDIKWPKLIFFAPSTSQRSVPSHFSPPTLRFAATKDKKIIRRTDRTAGPPRGFFPCFLHCAPAARHAVSRSLG